MFGTKRNLSEIYFGNQSNKSKKKSGGDKKKSSDKNDDETSDSEDGINLLDVLSSKKSSSRDEKIERDNNHIYFHSEVNRDSIFELCNLIREAEEECVFTSFKLNIEEIPIYLHINSFGGCVFSAFAAIDVINACRVPIHSIIEGASASAGTLISVVCSKRYIRPSAHMLIHQLSAGCWGKMSEIEDEFKNLQDLMEKIKNIYKEHASIPRKELTKILKHDLWFDSDKCLEYKLVDELWEK
jgi:ATP-dependent Clp endopeptidase proteolytic subunit ClpP